MLTWNNIKYVGMTNWDVYIRFLLFSYAILSILGVSLGMVGLMALLRYAMRDM